MTQRFNSAEEALAFIRAGLWKSERPKKQCGSGGCDGCKCKKNQEPETQDNWQNEMMRELGHLDPETSEEV